MLSQASIDLIAKALGLDAKVFAKGITSEDETTIELPKMNHFSDADLVTLKDNVSKEGYDRGAPAGREMFIKDINKAAGFEEGSGLKDAAKIIEAYKASVLKQANIAPDKKIIDLEGSIEKLQNTILDKDSDYSKLQSKVDNDTKIATVKSFIPKLPEGLGLDKDEVVDLFLRTHEISTEGISKGGNLIKDNMEKALGTDKVIGNWITERGWNKDVTGRGGGAGGGSDDKPSSMAEYEETLKEKGFTQGSVEANALLVEMVKDNPELGD